MPSVSTASGSSDMVTRALSSTRGRCHHDALQAGGGLCSNARRVGAAMNEHACMGVTINKRRFR